MRKSEKELAYLRDLSVTRDWTERFTNFANKHLRLPAEGNFLYFNAGTLTHALELREKLDKDVSLTCTFETSELRKIAEAKAAATKANIRFREHRELQSESFSDILADLSFVRPDQLSETIDEILYLTKKGGRVSIFLPTAGSFGEIFSYLWEVFLDIGLVEKGAEVERLLTEIPTVSQTEETANEAGLIEISSETGKEVFEYDAGKDFISSTLVADFLIPVWLEFLSEAEQQRTVEKLVKAIIEEHHNLSFRFSVKATFLQGIKG